MKRWLLIPGALLLLGCGTTTSFVKSETTTLGRVVIYRNGVAYFERYAELSDDNLKLAVPAERVDDFLKSLTVVDAQTGTPAPVAYPTDLPRSATGLIDMKITLPGPRPHKIRLSYVTEAPAWKSSYRVVLGKDGKVDVQAWAVVDNISGEDWTNVKLGVGSSSALSFRFDLHGVKLVQRETLQANDLFAQAPPMGGATYGGDRERAGKKVVGDLSDDVLAAAEAKPADMPAPPPPAPTAAARGASRDYRPAAPHGGGGGGYGGGLSSAARGPSTAPTAQVRKDSSSGWAQPAPQQQAQDNIHSLARSLQQSPNTVVVEGFAAPQDKNKNEAALDRANRLREQLVRQGLDPSKVVAVSRGEVPGRNGGVRVVEEAPKTEDKAKTQGAPEKVDPTTQEPIGTSHFESGVPMTVARGSSAMVSILHTETTGEVVYLYDPESTRGNAAFPFKAVRLVNPTDSVLESGPVTVFGDGRFIGEGMAEPIPAHSAAFVPFALDRQIVVETKETDHDQIQRILTVQRGVFSTEVKHTRRTHITLHNRTKEKSVVFLRHTVPAGYKLTKGPERFERVGGAHLFRVEVEPEGKLNVTIEAATPLYKTTDIRATGGMEMVRAYLSSAALEGPLKEQVHELLKLQQDMGNIEQRIQTTREQMGEYRQRMDELHAQIVTLRVVKTAGPLMQNLEKKLAEISDKLSKATIDLVSYQEQAMITRIHFQDGIADLSLEKKDEKPTDKKKGEKPAPAAAPKAAPKAAAPAAPAPKPAAPAAPATKPEPAKK